MTLGGLALAVGILVDDATVTIENINWHLEQGKDIESAIMDGARQIVIPATVSLLCICIVFVPMFALGGVAGYLFRPMAEAVVFALIASYVLSRTLVQHAGALPARQPGDARPRRATRPDPQSARAVSSADSSIDSRRVRAFYRRLLMTRSGRTVACSSAASCCVVVCLVRAHAVPRPELLSARRGHADQAARPGADRHADRGDGALVSTGSRPRSAR